MGTGRGWQDLGRLSIHSDPDLRLRKVKLGCGLEKGGEAAGETGRGARMRTGGKRGGDSGRRDGG